MFEAAPDQKVPSGLQCCFWQKQYRALTGNSQAGELCTDLDTHHWTTAQEGFNLPKCFGRKCNRPESSLSEQSHARTSVFARVPSLCLSCITSTIVRVKCLCGNREAPDGREVTQPSGTPQPAPQALRNFSHGLGCDRVHRLEAWLFAAPA